MKRVRCKKCGTTGVSGGKCPACSDLLKKPLTEKTVEEPTILEEDFEVYYPSDEVDYDGREEE